MDPIFQISLTLGPDSEVSATLFNPLTLYVLET